MPVSLIKLDHTNLDTPAYITRMREIGTALAGQAVFAPLATKLTEFTPLVDDLEQKNDAVEVAKQALKTAITARDAAYDLVNEAINALANGSEFVTKDPAQLQSGGWHLRAARSPVGPMPAPQNLNATGGDQDGEADLLWGPVSGRDTYIVEHASSATGPWTQAYVGKKSGCTIGGLVSGQLYYFRVRAVGSAGPGPWSDIATSRAT